MTKANGGLAPPCWFPEMARAAPPKLPNDDLATQTILITIYPDTDCAE